MEQLDLTTFCKTKAEAMDFIARLDRISDQVYQTNFSLEKCMLDEFGMQKKDKFIALLRDNNINAASTTNLKEFLQKLREFTAVLPVLSITLAFEPKEETLVSLSKWFLLNIKKQFLFDIQVDAKLIAGAAIGINGNFADYSVKEKVHRIIQEALNPPVRKPIAEAKHQNLEHMHLGR